MNKRLCTYSGMLRGRWSHPFAQYKVQLEMIKQLARVVAERMALRCLQVLLKFTSGQTCPKPTLLRSDKVMNSLSIQLPGKRCIYLGAVANLLLLLSKRLSITCQLYVSTTRITK